MTDRPQHRNGRSRSQRPLRGR